MKKNIYIHDTGSCSLRRLDSNKIQRYLTKNNCIIVKKPSKADIIICTTCAFNNEEENIALSKVKELGKYKAELIVAGCLPSIAKEELDKIFSGRFIETKQIEKIDELFQENQYKFNKLADSNSVWVNQEEKGLKRWKRRFRILFKQIKSRMSFREIYLFISKYGRLKVGSIYYLRISRGCVGNCSYCATKKAVGPLKSKPLDVCLSEFENGLKNGEENFIIIADDVGAYGIDVGKTFPDLINEILKIKGSYSINIEGINPRWLVKYISDFQQIFKDKRIKGISVPIQSANNRVLETMNRPYEKEKMLDAFLKIKNTNPDLEVGTDIIVGFPTEIEEEFIESINFIKDAKLDTGNIFTYSCKTKTKAELIEPKVPKKEMIRRMECARDMLRKSNYFVFDQMPYTNRLLFKKNTN